MKTGTHLDSVAFQLTPTRTRCDLIITANGKTEKIASGLLNPFLAHLKTAQDQIDKGGYSILLEPAPGSDTTWFTKGTVERFVRFVSTPEILERVHTLESEILQLEKAIAIQGNNDMGLTTVEDYQAKPVGNREGIKSTTDGNEEKAIVLYKPDAHPPEANGSTAEQGNSKVQLLKVLETRKIVLQKEQGMAFARAVAAGFDIDHMAPLLSFAECFGASRLMEACLRFMDLWKRKHETGQWLEIEAAEAMASPSEFSAMAASGIILSSVANQQNEPHGDLASETNGNPGLDASIDGRRFNDHQAQVGQQEYYQGQFPYPMFPPWPAHSPPGALPVYQPYPVQGVPYYQSYPASGPFYPPPHPHVEDSGRNTGRKGRRRRNSSVDSTDSSSESEALVMENGASQKRGSRKKDGKSGKKKSGVVVIRNLNYVASKGQNSSDSESPTASDSDTGKETMNNNSSSLKRKGNRAKPAGELNSNDKEEAIFGKESDGGHWEAFQNFLLRDSDEKGRADDQGMFGLEKKAQLKRRHNSGGHDPLAVGRDPVEAQDGRMSELDKVSGNASRMLRPSNDEGLMSRREGHHMDYQMDVQSLGMNGRKLAYRNNANDDFMTIGRESQSHISHSADPLAVNGFTNSNINTIGTSQDMTDESFIVPFRSMSLDEVGTKERTAIDIDSELPLTGQKSENSYTRTGNQANYEPDDLSLMPERGTGKDKMGYDPALEYERQAHIRDSASLHNRNKEAAASEAKQGSKKSRVTSDALDKKKSVGPIRKGKPSKLSPLDDARARAEKLRTYKADLQKLKKEKEEEQQKRLEALRRERQKRIAARGSSSVAPSPSSQQSKRQLPTRPSLSSHRGSKFSDSEPGSSSPLQRSKLRTVSLGSTESQKASKTSKSTNDIQLPGNRLTRSVSSLPEPRKEASGVTPDSKASMAHIRRLSEPKTSSTSNVALVKTRTPQLASKPKVSGEPESKKIVAHQLASKPKVSGEPESKKIAAIINLDKSKAATLPELKIKTPKGSLDVGQNKSAPKEMSQKVKVNKSSVASGSNNDKNPHENDVDDNPIIDKSVVMFEPEKTSVPVLSSGKSMGVQKEYHVNLENIEKAEMTPEFAAVHAPASPPDGVAILPIHSQLQEQTRSYEVNTSNTEKEPSRSSSTHTAEKPYQAPFARLSSVEEPCTMNSEYGKFPSVALGTVKTGAGTAKAQVSGFVNLKIENISEAPEKTQVKESPKGFKRLLKFGRKNQSLAAGEQSLESDKASINGTELDDNATNSASSSEVHTLKNLISQDETPTVGTTTQKSSRHFSLLSPFRSKNSEKKSTA